MEAAWPVFAAIGAFVLLVLLLGAVMTVRRNKRLARSGIAEIDRMNGPTFEHFLAVLFRQLGYQVEVIGRTGDFGADLVVTRDGVRCAVQAKQRSKQTVGIKAVQEVVGSLPHHRCERGLVVTNQRFTAAARQRARRHGKGLYPLTGGLKAQAEHSVMEAACNRCAHLVVALRLQRPAANINVHCFTSLLCSQQTSLFGHSLRLGGPLASQAAYTGRNSTGDDRRWGTFALGEPCLSDRLSGRDVPVSYTHLDVYKRQA